MVTFRSTALLLRSRWQSPAHRGELPRRTDHLLRAIPRSPEGSRKEISTPAAACAQGVFAFHTREFSVLGVSSTEQGSPSTGMLRRPQVSVFTCGFASAASGSSPRRPRGGLRGHSGVSPAPSLMCRDPGRGEALAHDQSRITHEEVRRLHRRRRRLVHRPPGPCDRLPRPQRRRQVHHHARHGRAHPAHVRRRHRSPVAASADLPNPGLEVGVLLDASAQHAGRTGREILTIAQRTMGLPKLRVEEMLDRVSLTEAEAEPPGAQLLARHAPAARHRHRAHRRPGGADPRRAGQRPRPGGHPLDARPAPGRTPTRAAPCCCPRTCCTRSRSSPTTSS